MRRVIFDTGPVVAWLCPRDQHHEWARRAFSDIHVPGVICEAVITEACHLAAKEGITRDRVIDFVVDGNLVVARLHETMPEIRDMLKRYADTPMDFADACITRLAQLHEDSIVCTTDTDFLVYRKNRVQMIPLLAPFSG